jgi:hypothetical protein
MSCYKLTDVDLTGEYRLPKMGDLYLNGTIALQASADHTLTSGKREYICIPKLQAYKAEPVHDWTWAVSQVFTGHKVRRKVWVDKSVLQLKPDTWDLWLGHDWNKAKGCNMIPDKNFINATDWEIVPEKVVLGEPHRTKTLEERIETLEDHVRRLENSL